MHYLYACLPIQSERIRRKTHAATDLHKNIIRGIVKYTNRESFNY